MTRLIIDNIGTLYDLSACDGRGESVTPLFNAQITIENGLVTAVTSAGNPSGSPLRPSAGDPYPRPPEIINQTPGALTIDAHGALVTPGLVDPHTHLVYGGHRAHEMGMKLAGMAYLDILAAGGGILSTVRATREANDQALYDAASRRLDAMLAAGTTTIEVKSGYGLSLEHELRSLRVTGALAEEHPIGIVSTFLGAHAFPSEYKSTPETYVAEVIEEMLPEVARHALARFCDVFCEDTVFTIDQSRRILRAGQAHGLRSKIHADEIAPHDDADMSGAELAAELGCVSADHCRETPDRGFAAMAAAGVVPVVLPATSFCLRGHHYADARAMIDEHRLPVALATDHNPGTSPTDSMQFVMAVAALELRMTPEEILAACTVNAARAIGEEKHIGSLTIGRGGDVVIWNAFDLDVLPYRVGGNQAAMVIKGGVVCAR